MKNESTEAKGSNESFFGCPCLFLIIKHGLVTKVAGMLMDPSWWYLCFFLFFIFLFIFLVGL